MSMSAFFVIMMVVVSMSAVFVIVVVIMSMLTCFVVVMVIMSAAAVLMIVVMLMVSAAYRADFFFHQFFFQGTVVFHGIQDFFTGKLLCRSGDDCRCLIQRTDQLHCCRHFFFCGFFCICTA